MTARSGGTGRHAWEVMLTSPPDRAEVVAELWFGREQFAEMRRTPAGVECEIGGQSGKAWSLPAEVVVEALRNTQDRLLEFHRERAS